jgi:hypothetical protein
MWLGISKSLDVVNDGLNNKVQLAGTEDVSGQFWKITNVASTAENIDAAPAKAQDFRQMFLSDFKVMINPKLVGKAETNKALAILSGRLEVITKLLKPKHLDKLKKVPIWLEYKKTEGGMVYHPSKDWLINNDYPAEMEKSIEINNVQHFIDWQGDQPFMVLHELAHAYEDLYLSEMRDKINLAYQTALAGGKYKSVPYIRGGTQRHYALNNKTEYFAELSEAYFGKNDFYPFNREELKQFDPVGYKLMQEAWK